MRNNVMLAAMLAVLGTAPQSAEAGDRGFGFRHFSGPTGTKFHRPHRDLKFDRRGFVGGPRHYKPGHFDHFGHGGFMFEFGTGDLVFKFGHVPRFKRHFDPRHRHSGLTLRFGQPRHFEPWHQQQ